MAKLKVFKKDPNHVPNPVNPDPYQAWTIFDEQGYVNVVMNLIYTANLGTDPQTLLDYLDADPNDRPDMLQDYCNSPIPAPGTPLNQRQYLVFQQKSNGNTEPISQANCRIYAEKDRKQGPRRSRVTQPIPDAAINDFSYLNTYAQKISDLWNGNQNAVPPVAQDRAKCVKFMFGVMMLTRCR
jgi:hypothetical protein